MIYRGKSLVPLQTVGFTVRFSYLQRSIFWYQMHRYSSTKGKREGETTKLGPLEKANLKPWTSVPPNKRTWPQESQDLVKDSRILAQDCYPTLRKVTSVILTGSKPKSFWSKRQFTRLAKFLTERHINDKDKLFKIRSWRLKATCSLLHAPANFLYSIRITSG
jgi:hypothetical protein